MYDLLQGWIHSVVLYLAFNRGFKIRALISVVLVSGRDFIYGN